MICSLCRPYVEEEGVDYLRGMLGRFPSACLREKTKGLDPGPLVAWMLTYPYGAFGCLHVMESHRRRKLGTCLVYEILERIEAMRELDNASTVLNHCFVMEDNVPSRRMLTRCDFPLMPAKATFLTWESPASS